jgi:hypothetical protein
MTAFEYIVFRAKCMVLAFGFFVVGCVLLLLELLVGPRRSQRIAERFYDAIGLDLAPDGSVVRRDSCKDLEP